MNWFPWTTAIGRRFLSRSRGSRVALAMVVPVFLAVWCLWYQPWRAHFRGHTASYWADVFSGKHQWRRNWTASTPPPSTFREWLDSLLDRLRSPHESFNYCDDDCVPVLEELLEHSDANVRLIAASYLSSRGTQGFRRAAPALVNALLSYPPKRHLGTILECLGGQASRDPESVKAAVPEAAVPVLLEFLDVEEGSEYDSIEKANAARILRAVDPRLRALTERKATGPKSAYYQFPAGWRFTATGRPPGFWTTIHDKTPRSNWTIPVLAQTESRSPRAFFNLCVAETSSVRDVELHVALKAVGGKKARGGGVAWRFRDNNNYYVACVNPLEDEFRLCKVIAGKCIQLGSMTGLKTVSEEWHELFVRQVGDQIECRMDDTQMLKATDVSITVAGQVGLWTEADAQTHFDRLTVTNLGR